MKWSGYGYAGLQNNHFEGTTPLKSFYKNYATSTMHSFQTPATLQLATASSRPAIRHAQPPQGGQEHRSGSGPRSELTITITRTRGEACATRSVARLARTVNVPLHERPRMQSRPGRTCTAIVLDHYTSAFHWAENNFAAIWLRPQWYLVTNSVLSDVQNGGMTIITGGDYTHSSVIPGFWGLVRNSIFIGHTQPSNGFARDDGPFNNDSGLDPTAKCEPKGAHYCLNRARDQLAADRFRTRPAPVQLSRRSGLSGFQRLSRHQGDAMSQTGLHA